MNEAITRAIDDFENATWNDGPATARNARAQLEAEIAKAIAPGEAVTLESALEAIEHVGRHNGMGRELEAKQMLERAALREPAQGWVMVPVEPTAHMCCEGRAVGYGYCQNSGNEYDGLAHAEIIYRAMLAAAQPQEGDK